MERRLITIVAADLVGYSRLMAADEEGTVSRFRAVRSELILPELSAADARLIKTMGDGLLVEFPSPVAAVRASLAIQQSMAKREQDQPEDKRLQFRVGINLGDVIIDGDDILGDGVNVAARLESLAPPGGICISRAVHEQLRGKIDVPLTALGMQDVKNMPEPVDVWRVEVAGVRARAAPKTSTTPPSLVVLPFDNMSSDPEQEFLADGIVEDVTTELSRFRTLTVIARNSAFTYKGTPKDVREIAEELGVRYVVEGSVRRAGERLRVTAQLIEAETGAHLWAERWDRTMADLFDVQDEMTSAIVTGVEPELGAHERTLSRRKPTESLTAWELAQKGYARFLGYTPPDFDAALELFEKSMALDPEFALAHAYAARVYFANVTLGFSNDYAGDVRAGLALAERSVTIDPKSDYGHVMRGALLKMVGRSRDSQDAFDVAERLNPNSIVLCLARCVAEYCDRKPDPKITEAAARNALRLSPRDPQAFVFHYHIGLSRLVANGWIHNEAVAEAYEVASRYPNATYVTHFATACANAELGRMADAVHHLEMTKSKTDQFSLKVFKERWAFYPWASDFTDANEDLIEKLVELGLPRE